MLTFTVVLVGMYMTLSSYNYIIMIYRHVVKCTTNSCKIESELIIVFV